MTSSSSSSPEISAAPSSHSQDRFSYKHATHEEVLEDLSSRFILNLPEEELVSLERICFQVEQAHWFYEDFIREENPKFPSLPLKKFSAMLFHACPLLRHWSHDHERAFDTFMQYKTRVPVCGAIMLNETWEKCLLVKGWKSSSGWGFPKGKINQGEPEHLCAVREVLEETGYNLAGKVNPEDVIQVSIREQKISLYIVPDVPEDFEFETRTRKEISRIEWFRLTDLPIWKRNKVVPGKFYLISPFIGPLKAFINARRPRGVGKRTCKSKQAHPNQDDSPLDHRNRIAPPYSAYVDSSTQESSSSSADNADPETPSPHYSEPSTHDHSNGRIASVSHDDNLDTQTLDPHFARLLSSLSMSANAHLDSHATAKQAFGLAIKPDAPPQSTTPIQLTASSTDSHLLPDPLPTNQSLHVKPLNNSLAGAAKPSSAFSPPYTSTPVNGAFSPGRFVPSSVSSLNARPTRIPSDAQVPSQSSASSLLPTVPHPTVPTHSKRRSSSTADISPYLTRLPEVPTSGKRLKQLALLESVADESEKLASIPSPASNTMFPGGHHNSFAPPTTAPPSTPPASATSNDFRVIYTSNLGAKSPVSYSFTSRPLPLPPQHRDDQPHVRPRTSQALHPDSRVGPSSLPFGSQSMSQSQLLSMINGAPPLYRTPVHQGLPHQPQDAHRQPPIQAARPFSFQDSTQAQTRDFAPIARYPPPLSQHLLAAPNNIFGFDSPASAKPTQAANSLLSILNGGR